MFVPSVARPAGCAGGCPAGEREAFTNSFRRPSTLRLQEWREPCKRALSMTVIIRGDNSLRRESGTNYVGSSAACSWGKLSECAFRMPSTAALIVTRRTPRAIPVPRQCGENFRRLSAGRPAVCTRVRVRPLFHRGTLRGPECHMAKQPEAATRARLFEEARTS